MKMNAVFYLALMFGLATCAVVEMNIKGNERNNERALFEKLIENFQVDRMLENNDFEPQNKIVVTEVTEDIELQNLEKMKCTWEKNVGECCSKVLKRAKLCIGLTVSSQKLQLTVKIGRRVILKKTFGGPLTKTFSFEFGIIPISLDVTLEKLSTHDIKVCFRIKVASLSTNLGCIQKHFLSNEINPLKGIEDWDLHDKISFGAEEFEADKPKRMEYLGERNKNKNVLI